MRIFLKYIIALSLFPLATHAQTIGDLRISGLNTSGQLANGETAFSNNFTKIADGATAVYAGRYHALYKDNRDWLWGWGLNTGGQLGDNPRGLIDEPVLVATGVANAFTGFEWTFYTKKNAKSYVVGKHTYYKLWDSPANSEDHTATPFFGQIKEAISRTAYVLYLLEDGKVYGSGWIFSSWEESSDEQYTFIADDAIDIAFRSTDPVILKSDGTLILFTGKDESRIIDTNVTAIEGEEDFIMYSKNGGDLYVYGSTRNPAAGAGGIFSDSPQLISSNMKRFCVGTSNTTAFFIDKEDNLWGMGRNYNGQLGVGDFIDRNTPTFISESISDVAATIEGTLILKKDGTVLATGLTRYGQFGARPEGAITPIPTNRRAKKVELADDQLFFIDKDDSLWATGYNYFGQLGLGHKAHISTPELVATNVSDVSANDYTMVYVDKTGNAFGSGRNSTGQLRGSENEHLIPTLIATDAKRVEAATNSTYILDTNNSLFALGLARGFRQETTSLENVTTPELVENSIIDFSGAASLFYVNESGELWGNGRSIVREILGRDSTENKVLIDIDVKRVEAEYKYVAYIKNDGTLWKVGVKIDYNYYGFRAEPELIDSDVEELAVCQTRILYRKIDGSLWFKTDGTKIFEQYNPGTTQSNAGIFQIHPGADVHDFSISTTNAAYITGDYPKPEVLELSRNKPSAEAGTPITVAVKTISAFESYTWYEGQPGDESKPITDSNRSSLDVYPYQETSYWVNVFNEAGESASETSVTLNVTNPNYAQWALQHGLKLQAGHTSKDTDFDGFANIDEYATSMDPLTPDSPLISINRENGKLSTTQLFNANASVVPIFKIGTIDPQTYELDWQKISAEDETSSDLSNIELSAENGRVNITLSLESLTSHVFFSVSYKSTE